jgi:D-alanine-D-alanine ligase
MTQNIAIIAGGDSGEYGISIKSGTVVSEMLDKEKFVSYLIQIKADDWFYELEGRKYQIDKNDFSLVLDGERVQFDCVFCAIHGTPGENGKMPAYFEMLNIPYTSSDSLVSALTFNKDFCNRVVSTYGIDVAKSVHLFRGEEYSEEQILEALNLPVFVKPNAGGSSVGMSKVNEASQLKAAIETAFKEDNEILIEEFIRGRELTCAVMEYKNQLYVFPVCEIISKKDFFDYESKYNPELAEEICPAHIPEALDTEIKHVSAMLYKKLNCKGVVRADYIYDRTEDTLWFLEINTVPGLTYESIVPKMAKEMDIPLPQLFEMMVGDAIWRKHQRVKTVAK